MRTKMEQKLIRIVRENPTISKINLAGELGIGRSTRYSSPYQVGA